MKVLNYDMSWHKFMQYLSDKEKRKYLIGLLIAAIFLYSFLKTIGVI